MQCFGRPWRRRPQPWRSFSWGRAIKKIESILVDEAVDDETEAAADPDDVVVDCAAWSDDELGYSKDPWDRALVGDGIHLTPPPRRWRSGDAALRRTGPPFSFVICEKPDHCMLGTPEGERLLHALGLLDFFHRPVPAFHESLCNEFLASYSHPAGYGVVGGAAVRITTAAIATLTGLPSSGGRRDFMPKIASSWVLPNLRSKKGAPGMLALNGLRTSAQGLAFVAAAEMITERVLCRVHPATSASAPVVLTMHEALQRQVEVRWAAVLSRRMRRAALYTKMRSTGFCYGEWLSGLILLEQEHRQPGLAEAMKQIARMEMEQAIADAKSGRLDLLQQPTEATNESEHRGRTDNGKPTSRFHKDSVRLGRCGVAEQH